MSTFFSRTEKAGPVSHERKGRKKMNEVRLEDRPPRGVDDTREGYSSVQKAPLSERRRRWGKVDRYVRRGVKVLMRSGEEEQACCGWERNCREGCRLAWLHHGRRIGLPRPVTAQRRSSGLEGRCWQDRTLVQSWRDTSAWAFISALRASSTRCRHSAIHAFFFRTDDDDRPALELPATQLRKPPAGFFLRLGMMMMGSSPE